MQSIPCHAAPVNSDRQALIENNSDVSGGFRPSPKDDAFWSGYTLASQGHFGRLPGDPARTDRDVPLSFAVGQRFYRDGKLAPLAPPPADRPTPHALVAELQRLAESARQAGDPVNDEVAKILDYVAGDCDVFRSSTFAQWDGRVDQMVKGLVEEEVAKRPPCQECAAREFAFKL